MQLTNIHISDVHVWLFVIIEVDQTLDHFISDQTKYSEEQNSTSRFKYDGIRTEYPWGFWDHPMPSSISVWSQKTNDENDIFEYSSFMTNNCSEAQADHFKQPFKLVNIVAILKLLSGTFSWIYVHWIYDSRKGPGLSECMTSGSLAEPKIIYLLRL